MSSPSFILIYKQIKNKHKNIHAISATKPKTIIVIPFLQFSLNSLSYKTHRTHEFPYSHFNSSHCHYHHHTPCVKSHNKRKESLFSFILFLVSPLKCLLSWNMEDLQRQWTNDDEWKSWMFTFLLWINESDTSSKFHDKAHEINDWVKALNAKKNKQTSFPFLKVKKSKALKAQALKELKTWGEIFYPR